MHRNMIFHFYTLERKRNTWLFACHLQVQASTPCPHQTRIYRSSSVSDSLEQKPIVNSSKFMELHLLYTIFKREKTDLNGASPPLDL